MKYLKRDDITLSTREQRTLFTDAVMLDNYAFAQQLVRNNYISPEQQAYAFDYVYHCGRPEQKHYMYPMSAHAIDICRSLLSPDVRAEYATTPNLQTDQFTDINMLFHK